MKLLNVQKYKIIIVKRVIYRNNSFDIQTPQEEHAANGPELLRKKRTTLAERNTCQLYIQTDHLFFKYYGTREAVIAQVFISVNYFKSSYVVLLCFPLKLVCILEQRSIYFQLQYGKICKTSAEIAERLARISAVIKANIMNMISWL